MGSAIVPDALATAEFACLALAAASALHLALKRPLRQDALAHVLQRVQHLRHRKVLLDGARRVRFVEMVEAMATT